MEEQKQSSQDNKAKKPQQQSLSISDDFLKQVYLVREQVLRDSKGQPFEDSVELLRREREKRTEYLMQVVTGQYGKDPYEEDRPGENIAEDTTKEQS